MPDRPATPPRILVIDDEPMVRCAINLILRMNGFEVAEAEHGEAALALLNQFTPDFVLSDLNMGPVDGLEFVRTVRGDARFRHLPIVMITAEVHSQRFRQVMQEGANGHLCKPFSAQELLQLIRDRLQLVPGKDGLGDLS